MSAEQGVAPDRGSITTFQGSRSHQPPQQGRTSVVRQGIMLPHWCETVAFVLAALLPFFLATRWAGLGFIASVFLGWGLIHFANVYCVSTDVGDDVRTAAVFKGVWLFLGPVFMAAWSAIAATLVLIVSYINWRIRGRPASDTFP